jgi:hypothetical protein
MAAASRWLVMPMATISLGLQTFLRNTAAMPLSTDFWISPRRCSTQPGFG